MLVPALLGVSFNVGVAPVATTWLWLRGVAGIWQQGHGTMEMSDRNEIEASRAHRRGSYVGPPASPLAGVASAALAAKAASVTRGNEGRQRKPSSRGTPAFKLWKRAADIGGGGASAVQHLGFNVVAAIRALHGMSMQQLKEQVDDQRRRVEEGSFRPPCVAANVSYPQQHQSDRDFVKVLTGLKKGHDRLEDMIRKADDHRARVEAKLDEVLEALSNSTGAGNAESKGRGSVSDATAPRAKLEQGTVGPPVVAGRESERRETSPPGVTAAGRGREKDDGGQRRATGGD
ncbi:unnamed protein product, partial [Ectocarpus sp. 12 AP-2014]